MGPCKDPMGKVESLHLEVTEEQVQGILSQVTSHINVAAATTKRLLLVEDYLESAKFALAAYLATFLGAVMNSLTLVIIAWVAAFPCQQCMQPSRRRWTPCWPPPPPTTTPSTRSWSHLCRNSRHRWPPRRSRRFAKSEDSCQKLERVKSLNLDFNSNLRLNLDLPKVL